MNQKKGQGDYNGQNSVKGNLLWIRKGVTHQGRNVNFLSIFMIKSKCRNSGNIQEIMMEVDVREITTDTNNIPLIMLIYLVTQIQ